ncbi:MAG: DinB family protein [Alicyclobacillus sp.]|nr:DinB family protein [Alicyclobacillus sp.]
MMSLFLQQYQLIQNTRQALFSFLETIPLEQLHVDVPHFGHRSIIRTHVHVADCYLYWLGKFSQLRSEVRFPTEEDIANANVAVVRSWFEQADDVAKGFIETYEHRWLEPVSNHVRWQADPFETTPLGLLTHTITHEFHHKGQIVTMARQLGYVPPDTDLVL